MSSGQIRVIVVIVFIRVGSSVVLPVSILDASPLAPDRAEDFCPPTWRAAAFLTPEGYASVANDGGKTGNPTHANGG